MKMFLQRIFRGSSPGQGLTEYALIVAFVALAGVSLMSGVGGSLSGMWITANSTLSTDPSAGNPATNSGGGGGGDHHGDGDDDHHHGDGDGR